MVLVQFLKSQWGCNVAGLIILIIIIIIIIHS